MNTIIRKAAQTDAAAVAELYSSLVGTEGCTWNEYYPTIEDVRQDVDMGALYVAADAANGEIAAAAAMGPDEELRELTCFSTDMRKPCALFRVGVKPCCQKQGLAKKLILHMEENAARRGYDGVCLLVGKQNLAALALYAGLGYRHVGEAVMYEQPWYCCEKRLSAPQTAH